MESTTETIAPRLYFAYGSNLWLQQMEERCPESKYIGVAILDKWKWIINTRGYANVIPSHDDHVYGFMYSLSAKDEAALDIKEGVPDCYEKQMLRVEWAEELVSKDSVEALVYVDIQRLEVSKPKKEYVYRMGQAMADAAVKGIPESYLDKYLRPFFR